MDRRRKSPRTRCPRSRDRVGENASTPSAAGALRSIVKTPADSVFGRGPGSQGRAGARFLFWRRFPRRSHTRVATESPLASAPEDRVAEFHGEIVRKSSPRSAWDLGGALAEHVAEDLAKRSSTWDRKSNSRSV